MMLKVLAILILLSSLFPISISAEIVTDEKFESISIDEGLSNEDVTIIFQDSKGYMWIGTKDGLNRYDGEKIKIYNCNFEDENSLSSTYINDIEEDDYGNIWIGTDHGLDFLNTDTDTIIKMRDIQNNAELGELNITSLLKSSYEEGIMWVGTEDGLYKIDINKNTIEAFYYEQDNPNSLTSSAITCIEEGDNNLLWVGTKSGINVIDKNSKVSNAKRERLYITHISKDNSGNMWASTKEGVFIINVRGNKKDYIYMLNSDGINEFNLNEGTVRSIYDFKDNKIRFYNNFIFNDSKNNTWLSSSNGAIKYSKDKNEFDVIQKDIRYRNSLTSNVITCFYEDSNGTMWIGTDKGVNILSNNTIFNYICTDGDKNIVSILQHNDYIWVATKFKGIDIYSKKNGELVYKMYEDENFSLNDRYIRSLFRINEIYVLIVTNKEIIYINTEKGTYSEKLIADDYYSELSYIYSDEKDIWIATTTDFCKYNINTGEKTYYNQAMNELGINPGLIKYILQDNKDENVLWLGGVDIGLIKYHKDNGVLERYVHDHSNTNSLLNNYINCMAMDNNDNLWIGTNIGLSRFNIKTKEFTSYTTAEGLSNNFINTILIDDDGDIWISTNRGLNKFDIREDKFIRFGKSDGLHGYQFNLNSGVKLKSGFMIFGTTEGCIYFNINTLQEHKLYKDEVVIGDIYIGKDKIVYDGSELVLKYNYKDLRISYFLPNYESLNSVTYEYMLEGIDSEWIYVDSQNSLDFKFLEPGKYKLKVRARDGHGELTKETIINIRVRKPIWKTHLAYIVYLSIILAVAIYIINYVKILHHLVNQKTMKLNKQLEENKKLSEEIIDNEKFKNNYFVNLSHELRTPINVIISTVQLISSLNRNGNITSEKINTYMDIIKKSSNSLLKIINDIIDSSKIETGKYKINKKNNDIVYIVEEAALNMSKFIEEKGLSLIIDPEIEEKVISFDETEIERCIINLLANAVKFTEEGGEIRVYIKEVEKYIEITIEDTGIGISKEDQEFIFKRFSQVDGTGATKTSSSGIGLTLVKYIVELHEGYVNLESELNKGSRFTIGIPDIVE